MQVSVFLSITELYNGELRDLLHPINRGGPAAAKRRKSITTVGELDGDDGCVVLKEGPCGVEMSGSNTLRTPVASIKEVMRLFNVALASRAQACTNLNEHSSRSHAIYTFDVVREAGAGCKTGRLHVIDLAGSERTALSGVEGEAMLEAKSINMSLSVLGVVLSALSKRHEQMSAGDGKPTSGEEGSFVPYRRSKLTLLLKDSLGGNSRTLMVACVRAGFPMQTRQTLMYV